MANSSMTILELFHRLGATKDVDFLREGVKALAQAVMELEGKVKTGADKHERTTDRKVYRNGYRNRIWDSRVGTIDLKIPKVREGSFFPSLLETAREQLRRVVDGLLDKYPKVAALLDHAADDVLAYMAFPSEHRRQIHSTNTLERLNFEIKLRTDVVGIFPNRAAEIRLVGAVLAEQNDEWLTGRWYFSQESMSKLSEPPDVSGLLAADQPHCYPPPEGPTTHHQDFTVSADVVGLFAMAGPYRARLQPAFNTPGEVHSQVLANATNLFTPSHGT